MKDMSKPLPILYSVTESREVWSLMIRYGGQAYAWL